MQKLISTAILVALSGTAFAQAQMPSPDEMLKQTDKNGDGIITKEEAAGTPMANFFDRIDADHDGKITKEELLAFTGRPAPGNAAAPPAK